MQSEEFNYLVQAQMDRCIEILGTKAQEYATEDRLHNFKVAANLQGTTLRQTLAGMMAKHTVSIYDMCNDENAYPISVWNEKISDHINYLLLLDAIVNEERFDAGLDELMTAPAVPTGPETAGDIVARENHA